MANNATSQALLLSEGGITYSGITSHGKSSVISQYHSFGTNPDGTPILVQKVYVPKTNGFELRRPRLIFQWDDPDALVVGGVKQITTDYDLLTFSVAKWRRYLLNPPGARERQQLQHERACGNRLLARLHAGTQYRVRHRADQSHAQRRRHPNQATHVRWNVETDASQIIADFVGPNGSGNTRPPRGGHLRGHGGVCL